jgi:hypothetical protein
MTWRSAVSFMALFCQSLFALGASSQLGPKPTQVHSLTVADEVVQYLKPPEVSARDSEALEQPEVAHLFRRYRYAWRGTAWQFREIVSPLIQHYALFWFFASGGLDDYSELTLLINRETRQQYLIPIQNRSMVQYPDVAGNPHNIAIFNGLVAAESIRPQSATDWLRLALFYLNIVGERHQISDWEDASGDSHPGMLTLLPRLKNLNLLPLVSCEAGKCDVTVFDLHRDQSHCVAWDLEFDSHGVPPQLNTVSRELRRLAGAQR